MAGDRTLAVRIIGDADSARRAFNNVDDAAGKTGGKLSKFSGTAKLAMAGAGVALVGFGKSSIDASIEAEKASSQLADSISKNANLRKGDIKALDEQSTAIMKKTRFDDEDIKMGQSKLALIATSKENLTSLTQTAVDYAAKSGKSAEEGAGVLVKASQGSTKALKELGVSGFKPTGDKAKDLTEIQRLMNEKVGGFAEKEGKTAAGQAAELKNQFGELQEGIGGALVPILLKLAGVLMKVVKWLGDNKPVAIALAIVVGGVLATAFVVWAIGLWGTVAALFAVGGALAFVTLPIAAIVLGVLALIAAFIWGYQNVDWFRAAVDTAIDAVGAVISWLWNSVVRPVFDFIVGHIHYVVDAVKIYIDIWIGIFRIAAGAVQWLWSNIVQPVFGFIASHIHYVVSAVKLYIDIWIGVFRAAAGIVTWLWDTVRDTFNTVVGFVSGLPGRIAGAASGMWNGIRDAFKAAVNWIIDKWNGLKFGVHGFGVNFDLHTPQIPRFHSGGIFTAPGGGMEGLALLQTGERVIARNGAGGGAPIILQISGVIGDKREVGRVVVEAITEFERRSGSRWRQ